MQKKKPIMVSHFSVKSAAFTKNLAILLGCGIQAGSAGAYSLFSQEETTTWQRQFAKFSA